MSEGEAPLEIADEDNPAKKPNARKRKKAA
jgi:hypothetical protein